MEQDAKLSSDFLKFVVRYFVSVKTFSPVNIQRWGRVEGELLFAGSRGGIPDDGGSVHPGAENVVPGLVPFQSKYRPFVLTQSLLLLSIGVPDPGIIMIEAFQLVVNNYLA